MIYEKTQCIQLFQELGCCSDELTERFPKGLDHNNYTASVDAAVPKLRQDKMMAHILDCLEALRVIHVENQRIVNEKQNESPSPIGKGKQGMKVFAAVLSRMGQLLVNQEAPTAAMAELLCSFPDKSKMKDERTWLPLHWAIVVNGSNGTTNNYSSSSSSSSSCGSNSTNSSCELTISDADVKAMYCADPEAFGRFHHTDAYPDSTPLTPAHLLCIQERAQGAAASRLPLIRWFACHNTDAFVWRTTPSPGFEVSLSHSALHAACRYGQPTVELLQFLLQLDSTHTKEGSYIHDSDEETPLGLLCRYQFSRTSPSQFNDLVGCLLGVDSSAAVVFCGVVGLIKGLVKGSDGGRFLDTARLLLQANAAAAEQHDADSKNLLHWIAISNAKLQSAVAVAFIRLVHAHHKECVREVSQAQYGKYLPVHYAAQESTADVVECLLDLYPESASMLVQYKDSNLLHLAVQHKDGYPYCAPAVVEAKVRYLTARYPTLLMQRDANGYTPLHCACAFDAYVNDGRESCAFSYAVVRLLCEALGRELVEMKVQSPPGVDVDRVYDGWSALCIFVSNGYVEMGSPVSEAADCFRLLLRACPEVPDFIDICNRVIFSWYEVNETTDSYFARLVLGAAAPVTDPKFQGYCQYLNWKARKMAMFLAYKAHTANVEPTVFARLRFEDQTLLRHVVSFL
jgi:ankyrin repeat protein